ncbi:microtubule-associated protein 70-1 [Striga asiatica]|uniref:Microtubule-associated protein 70-1 n=1 Tax=Striga asiatica TaxID=4170 RepID=A0A5A7R9X4_STRAF|nr:microtubule-associated protein 70-1 [Striga asiatica]
MPLEAELKITRTEVPKLQEDNKAFDWLTKLKKTALLDAERMVQMALTKASLVDDPIAPFSFKLSSSSPKFPPFLIETCSSLPKLATLSSKATTFSSPASKIIPFSSSAAGYMTVDGLQKKNQERDKQIEICRQKVSEKEKLTQTVLELEELVLA